MFTKTRIILFIAEIAAVAILRAIFMLRRDRALPHGSKVSTIRGRPVFNRLLSFTNKPKPFGIEGWTPQPPQRKMPLTPDNPPDV